MDQCRELRICGLRPRASPIYLRLFDWSPPPCEIAGIEARVLSAHLLANGRKLTFRQAEGKLQIHIPQEAPDADVSVYRGQDLLVKSLNELHFKNTDQPIYSVVSGSILPTMTRSHFELASGGVARCH